MLDDIDAHSPGLPVLIGGDCNTSSFDLAGTRIPTLGEALADHARAGSACMSRSSSASASES
jgi:hypothetical protein